MKTWIVIIICSLLEIGCNSNVKDEKQPNLPSKDKSWQLQEVIDLGEVSPIGITQYKEEIWLTDGDNNKLVKLNSKNEVEVILEDLERPMHLDSDAKKLYIPEYGADVITTLDTMNNKSKVVFESENLDAPAGFSINENQMAIADFYNHQIHFYNGNDWLVIGSKGKEKGELHYPTDVQIVSNKIYVADAYNHRVQIFDKAGKFMQVVGEKDSMNASTGLFVTANTIWVTDFENNRVLNYNLAGGLRQVLQENIDKPTDVLVIENELYVTNYGGKQLLVYRKI